MKILMFFSNVARFHLISFRRCALGVPDNFMSFLFCHNLFLFIIIDFYKTSENPHPSFEQSSIGSLRHPVTGCDLVTFKNMNNILVMLYMSYIVMKIIVTWKC